MQDKNKNNLPTLGKRLRSVREQAGISQSALAERLGFSKAAVISRFERGERLPSVDILIKLAELYHIDLHWLLTGQPSPGVEIIKNTLKPFVLAHLNEVLMNMQGLEAERMSLASKQAAGETHIVRLEEIREETAGLHQYYKAVLNSLDDSLKTANLKIELDYNLTPEQP